MYYYDGCDYEDMGYDGCDSGFAHQPECYEDSDCRGSDICEFNYCVSNPNRADDGHEDDPDFGYNDPDADLKTLMGDDNKDFYDVVEMAAKFQPTAPSLPTDPS